MVEGLLYCARREARKGLDTLYFRIHSSGEFYSVDYIVKWQDITKKLLSLELPTKIALWAPTRQYKGAMLQALIDLQALSNDKVIVAIRPSVMEIGDSIPVIEGLSAGSGVQVDGTGTCPAVKAGIINRANSAAIRDGEVVAEEHSCRGQGCRKCWLSLETPITYDLHGHGVSRSMA